MRGPRATNIAWDHQLEKYLETREQSILERTAIGVDAVDLLLSLGLYGLMPVPLVPVALGLGRSVHVEELGFDSEFLLRGCLQGPDAYINELHSLDARRQILAHECGHAAMPWHLTVEARAQRGGALPPARPVIEVEADYFGAGLRFQGSLFADRVSREPLCLKTALVLADKHFHIFPQEALTRYVEDHGAPCIAFRIKCLPEFETLLVTECSWSHEFEKLVKDPRHIMREGALDNRSGDHAVLMKQIQEQHESAPFGYHSGIIKHCTNLSLEMTQGSESIWSACIKALYPSEVLLMLSPAELHLHQVEGSEAFSAIRPPPVRSDLVDDWQLHEGFSLDLLQAFDDLSDPRLAPQLECHIEMTAPD